MPEVRPVATFRRLALRNYCIACDCYDAFVKEMAIKKAQNGGVEYVHPDRAEKFMAQMVPMFSPYIWDWYTAPEGVPTVPEFKEKLGKMKLSQSA